MQVPEGSAYDPDRYPLDSEGGRGRLLSGWDAAERMGMIFDSLEHHGLGLDAMYYDGFAAHGGLPEDFSPSHRMTRRGNLEAETACFAETRRRGLVPGAELARFWAVGECDFFFFTDWASDRLSNEPTRGCAAPAGMPVPLFQLVFNDCFMAGFSGGGYSAYASGYDWWKDRTPRLYELLFASAPSYNWLPYPVVPMVNWGSEQQRAKQQWLVRWSAFHRTVAFAEMVSHQFLDGDGSRQRTGFANGVEAEFDFAGEPLPHRGRRQLRRGLGGSPRPVRPPRPVWTIPGLPALVPRGCQARQLLLSWRTGGRTSRWCATTEIGWRGIDLTSVPTFERRFDLRHPWHELAEPGEVVLQTECAISRILARLDYDRQNSASPGDRLQTTG